MITNIIEFKKIYESNNVLVNVEDSSSLLNIIQSTNDYTVFDRIIYLDNSDFSYYEKDVNAFFVVLTEKTTNKIIGVSKIGYFNLSAYNKNNYSISYFSIDKNYRYSGYSRLMCDALFKHAKLKGYEISTSQYTVLGKNQLEKLFIEYANKYKVKFYNNIGKHDTEKEYTEVDGKLYRNDEI